MKRKSKLIEKSVIHIVLLGGGLLMIVPLLWAVLTSFKTPAEAMLTPPTLLPTEWIFDSYIRLFTELNFGLYLRNTLVLVAFSFVTVLFNMMAGYGFAKFHFKNKEKLFYVVLATMMIPGQATMIPNFLIINKMGLVNTFAGMILPGLAGAFGIFLFRQFMETVPDELSEAAKIDGAGNARIFLQIIVPVCKPIIAVQAILGFIGAWNSFLWPLIIANSESLFPLGVGLALLRGQNTIDFPLQMAGASLMVVPVIIVFLLFQKYIIEGFTTSGLK